MNNLFLKRGFSLLLACLLVLSLVPPVQIFAESVTVVYVDPVNGNDASDGTEAFPVKSVEAAYKKLTAGGTVVLLDTLTVDGITFPACAAPVTITSATGKEGIITTNNLRISSDTTFENITLTLNKDSSTVFLSGEGYNLTIGEGVVVVPYGTQRLGLIATNRYGATGEKSPTLTAKSGTWSFIYGTHGQNITGDVTVIVDGASCSTISPAYNGVITGNLSFSLKNGTVNNLNLKPTHKDGKITGNYTVTVGEGANVVKTTVPSTGTVEGKTQVKLDGGSVATLTGNAAMELVLNSGTFGGAATGFGSVAIDIPAEKTLTLSGSVTADTVQAAGTLCFDGTGSLTAKAVTGTVNCTFVGEVKKNNVFITAPADADIRFPADSGVVSNNGQYVIQDLVDFQGMVIRADKNMSMTFYTGHEHAAEDKIEPYAQEEDENGIISYYFPNAQGYYCYTAKRTGYYTVYQRIYMSPEEAKVFTVEEVPMEKRAADGWDYTYYYGQVDEFIEIAENDMTEAWHQDVELVTPVFTDPTKAAHQMTTQRELEDFIAAVAETTENMYVFSIGKSAKYGHDIPIVFFTKTDLSGCDTLEEVAAALKRDGLENVGYKAQMHGDEHAAGEGALNVIYQLAKPEYEYLLDEVNIYVMPRINPDAAQECQRNLRSASMLYPDVTSSTDPNRHNLSLASHESRLYLNTVWLFDPVAELDGHERQRSSNVGDITISSSWRYGEGQAMLDLQVDLITTMFAELAAEDLSGAWYSDNVNTTPGTNTRSYASAQGRIHLLMETRGIYLGMENYGSRVASQIVSAMTFLKYCAEHAEEMRALTEAEREGQITRGKTYEETEQLYLASTKVLHPEYNVETEKFNFAKGTKAAFTQQAYIYEYSRTRSAPTAYVIPKGLPKEAEILELMALQHIDYYELPANTAIPLQQYSGTVGSDRTTSNVELTAEQYYSFPDGAYVFQMDQVNGYVLFLLMEPDNGGTDLVEQGRIPVGDGGVLPIYRYVRDLTEEEIGITYTVATAAPTGFTAQDATAAGNDGVITGLQADKLYEYKAADGDAYIPVEAGTTQITGLTPGAYYIRYRADANGTISMDATCVVGCNVTVYLSADKGDDTNAGTTEAAAVATIEAAYAKLDELIGTSGDASQATIILLDDYTLSKDGRYDLPTHSYPLTIQGKTQSVKLIFDPVTESEAKQQLAFHGDTTLDNLTFHAASSSKYDYIFACGNKLVITASVKSTSARSSTYPAICGGDYSTTVAGDVNLTVLGGTWSFIYATGFKASHKGTATVIVDGVTIKSSLRVTYSGTPSGDTVIKLSNVSLGTAYMGTYYSGNISGDVTFVLGDNVKGTIYTGARRSGNMNGTANIVVATDDFSGLTLKNAVGADNTSGTIAKAVITYAKGTAQAVEGFENYAIDTTEGGKVTLGSNLNVESVIGGGSLELAGYSLTGIRDTEADEAMVIDGKLVVSDSATADQDISDGVYGKLVDIEGAVAADGYVALTKGNETSFHAAKLDIKTAVIRPSVAGVYYTGSFTYDELLEENVEAFGMAISLYNNQPSIEEDDEESLYTTGSTSALITNILSTERDTEENIVTGDTPVYVRAYIKLTDGTVVYGDAVGFSLKTLVRNADKNLWGKLTDLQKQGLLEMYAAFSDVLSTWQLKNIK
ncbi:MAG: hypothetical protein J6Q54_06020 [Oscillospiraceae bacterium]|nr:hypothetical protein [Oscillospiraceae bacterium]